MRQNNLKFPLGRDVATANPNASKIELDSLRLTGTHGYISDYPRLTLNNLKLDYAKDTDQWFKKQMLIILIIIIVILILFASLTRYPP